MRVLCIGAAHIDEHVLASDPLERDASIPATVTRAPGGVTLNVATALARLGINVSLASLTGMDSDGDVVVQHCVDQGIDVARVTRLDDADTARYLAILEPDGYLAHGLVLDSIYEHMTPEWLASVCADLPTGQEILVDANLPQTSLEWLAGQARLHHWHLSGIAVSTVKTRRFAKCLPGLTRIFLSRPEAYALLSAIGGTVSEPEQAAQSLFEHGVKQVLLTRGADGMIGVNNHGVVAADSLAYDIRNVTGAGDNAVAGWMSAHLSGKDDEDCLDYAMAAAALALDSPVAVPAELSIDKLHSVIAQQKG